MKIYFISFIIYFIISFSLAFAQKENYHWTLPDSTTFDFNTNSQYPSISTNGINNGPINAVAGAEANATISDANGSLLFYLYPHVKFNLNFDGFIFNISKLINKNHQIMTNGDSLFCGTSATNGALILPSPSHIGRYFLFTQGGFKANNDFSVPLYYHTIDLNYNNGLGKVIEKNVLLHDFPLVEKLAAVRQANGRDWWIFAHKMYSNEFIRWALTPEGLSEPYYQAIGKTHTNINNAGEMLFSPDARYLGLATGEFIEIFNFDRCSGEITTLRYSLITEPSYFSGYGCSFSPSNRYFYVSGYVNGSKRILVQFDLFVSDVFGSRKTIVAIPEADIPYVGFGQHEIGPDGKIYIGTSITTIIFNNNVPTLPPNINTNLSVIHSPDSAGLACNFVPRVLATGKVNFGFMPHFPNFGLGALPGALLADAGPDRFLCPEKNTVIGTPPVPGWSYLWVPSVGLSDTAAAQPTASPTVTTTYTLTVTSDVPQACGTSVDVVTVFVNETALSPDFSFVLDGFAATFESNVSDLQNYTLKWNFGTGDSSLLASPVYVFPDTGLYTVTLVVSDTAGCFESVSKTIHVEEPNKRENVWNPNGIKIYPNPAKGNVTIDNVADGTTVEIYDARGAKIDTRVLTTGQNRLPLAGLRSGVYLFRFINGVETIATQKVQVLE